jgi:hypothetical protein
MVQNKDKRPAGSQTLMGKRCNSQTGQPGCKTCVESGYACSWTFTDTLESNASLLQLIKDTYLQADIDLALSDVREIEDPDFAVKTV